MSGATVNVPDYRAQLGLSGRTMVVLGAGQGIGEQVAHALSQGGARVVCVDSAADRAQAVAQAVGGTAMVADVTQEADVARVFDAAAELAGDGQLGLVDVVGIVLRNDLEGATQDSWHRQFQLVIDHAWLAMRHGARVMKGRGGTMVFVGSIAGAVARTGPALAYASAKAGLHHLVKCMALELGPQGIRVNAVAPVLTRTPRLVAANPPAYWASQAEQIPLRRAGEPSDIAGAALFLSSPLAGWVSGQILMVDGGSSLVSGGFSLASSGPAGR